MEMIELMCDLNSIWNLTQTLFGKLWLKFYLKAKLEVEICVRLEEVKIWSREKFSTHFS